MAYGGCPGDYELVNGVCKDGRTESTLCDCDDPARGVAAPPTPMVGNPVSITTGYKVQDEIDYASGDGLFTVKRRHVSTGYRKDNLPQLSFGEAWQGLIPGRLVIHDYRMVNITWLQGNGESFHTFGAGSVNDDFNWNYSSHVSTRGKLTMVTSPSVGRTTYFSEPAIQDGPAEFRLTFGNGDYILFRRATAQANNRSAVPIERGYADGYTQYFDYADTGLFPYRVRDSFGRQMLLSWVDTPRDMYNPEGADPTVRAIKSILLPDNTTLTYDYDQANTQVTGSWTDTFNQIATIAVPGRKDRLREVRRTNAAGEVIWKRSYAYDDVRWPYALTGINDQNATRLSTYSYNAGGLIASSERAGGVDRHEFRQYRLKTNGVVDEGYVFHEVTNPLGRKETYNLWRHNYWKPPYLPRSIRNVVGEATEDVPADQVTINMTGETFNAMVSSVVDKKGYTTAYTLDTANRRPTAITEAQGTPQARVTNITWHPTNDWPTKIERTGLKVEHTYSAIGQMLTRTETDTTTHSVPYSTNGQTRTWTYTWGAGGRLASINGPKPVDAHGRDDMVTFVYDASGNLQASTNGLGHVTTFADYDAYGLPGSMTDPNGIVTEYSYDALGRATAVRVKHPSDVQLDAVTSFEYDLESRVVGLTQPGTDKLIFDYNLGGQLTAIRMASGERIDLTNDAMGNVTTMSVKRADGSVTRSIARTFDELGRMLTETLGSGRTTKWTYDKNGNATQAVSARSFATQAAFDPLDRLVSTVAPDSGTTATGYNALDKVTSFTDAISVQTSFVRNGFGDVIQEVSPDRGTSTHYYNEAGELTASIDGRGQRVDYTRDILGRVTSKAPVGLAGEAVNYAWATAGIAGSYGVGRLASVTDASGTTSFAYDHRGNLLTRRQTIGSGTADLAYAYDLADRIAQITYPSGRIVAYTRDTKGRVVQVSTKASASDSWVTLASSIAYEPWGSITGAQYGNGLSLAQVWTDGRLALKRLIDSGRGTDLSHLAYSYDANDNIGAIRDQLDGSRSAYYGYDANDRLSFASLEVGTPANDNETYSYAAGINRLASVTNGSGTRSIAYDGRGNTIGESRPGGANVGVTYDGYGRLLTYTRTGDPAQANAYNGLDERVRVTSGGDVRRYVYDPDGRVVGEYGLSASDVIAETIWLQPEVTNDNQPLGGDDGVGGYAPLAIATGSGGSAALTWVHGNHLGVPIAYTDASGAAVPPPSFTLPGYPGQLRTLPDLYYNHHRDYDSSLGRYIQADPIGLEGGDNPYHYAEGNPLKNVDPDGLNPGAVRGAIAVGDAAGQGFVWWCRSNMALCARTVGPPIVRAAKACNELIKSLTGDDDYCYQRWEREYNSCDRWYKYGFRAVNACRDRANKRHILCTGNGGRPDPNEPAEWYPPRDWLKKDLR